MADALAGLIERLRGDRQPASAHEADQPTAEIAVREEHEDHQHDDQAGGGQRLQQRRQLPEDRWCLHHHRHRLLRDRGGRRGWPQGRGSGGFAAGFWGTGTTHRRWRLFLELFCDLLSGFLELLDDAACAELTQVGDLALEVFPIARQFVGERRELAGDDPANAAQAHKGQHDDEGHGEDPWHAPAVQHGNHRVQHKREQHRKRHRQQHHTGPIQTRQHHGDTGEHIE